MKGKSLYAGAILLSLALGSCNTGEKRAKSNRTVFDRLEKMLSPNKSPTKRDLGKYGMASYDAKSLYGEDEISNDTIYNDLTFSMDNNGNYKKIPLVVYESDSLGLKLSVDDETGDFWLNDGTNAEYLGNMHDERVSVARIGAQMYSRSEETGGGFESMFAGADSSLKMVLGRFGIYGHGK